MPSRGIAAALLLAAASATFVPARTSAQDPPGTPHPSKGAPGDKPGRTDPFGTEGAKALQEPSDAERAASDGPALVERIDIAGNRRTHTRVVRRHLVVEEGEVATPEAILVSRVRLVQLGPFSRVDVEALPGSGPGRIVLRFEVEERTSLTVTDVLVGQTPVSRPYAGAGVAESNLLGLGLGASLSLAGDLRGRRGGRLALYHPDLGAGRRTFLAGVRAAWQEGKESGCATPRCDGRFDAIPWVHYRRAGAEVDAGFRPGAFSRLLFGYRLESIRARSDPGVAVRPPSLREGASLLSALVVGFDVDTRADTFLPRKGARLQATVTIGSAALGSDHEYSRYLVQAERWFPQRRGRALRVDLAAGLVQGDAPPFERFYAADWSYFSVGLAAPRALELNFSPDARYDALLLVLGGEWSLPLWERQGRLLSRGSVALGARAVYTARTPGAARSLLSEIPLSLDASLRVDTRVGVFGVGLGYVAEQILKAVPLRVPGVDRR
jgi:hypothetical protein